ncbi:MAG TPA: ribokinase [Chitinophagaceae bacterium]|jgi:ribokinase|nr:ribokinase [Chitinophagaceae bacterium]
MKPSLVVVGSTNTDMVIKADHLPAPGETILGGNFFMNPGGKGANQAVAARRMGADVIFITKTGNDIFGRQSIQLFEEEGIGIDHIISDPVNPSGVALIAVDKSGENCIVVASGANANLVPADLKNATEVISGASTILMQLEIPVKTVEFVASIAKANGIKVILNPAPVCELPPSVLQSVSIITPNRKEAEMLSGISINDQASFNEAAHRIKEKGVETVIITLGAEGAFIFSNDLVTMVPAPQVVAVDTTAAGDVFNGALAVALSEEMPIIDAVSLACHAAALSVTRLGAQSSAPHRPEVEAFLQRQLAEKKSSV